MKKLLIVCLFFLGMMTVVNAQDTIIEHENFRLQIRKVTEKTNPYEYIKTGENFEIFEYQWTNNDLRGIIEDWMTFMELEEIDYRIEDNVAFRNDFFKLMDIEKFVKDLPENDSVDISKLLTNRDVVNVFMGYDITYKRNTLESQEAKAVNKEAFIIFCEIVGLEIEMIPEFVTYWELEIVDIENASISYDQNTHWKRTDTEEYIYYERIKYRRIADLLSRKLDTFVKPVPYNAKKFDVRMPYSDDVFDLKYAMIEHGLELTEVTEEIEVIVIRAKAKEN